MPTTIAGQKGYDYQYLVTTFFTLQVLGKSRSAWTEVDGHEDAFFKLEEHGSIIPVEVQVKKRKNRIELSDIAEMLCHFEEGATDRCLLSRMTQTNIKAYFITNNVASDDVAKLSILADRDSFDHIKFDPPQAIIKKLVSELAKVKDGSVTLASKRDTFCQKLSIQFKQNIEQLKDILSRCYFLDGLTEKDLVHRIDLLLEKQHHIASSFRSIVSDRLIKAINQAKGEKDSFLPAVREILRRTEIHLPVLSPFYVIRPDETELKDSLLKNGYLLLTGPSFCGKSGTAASIGWSFLLNSDMIAGYSQSLDTAEAFLLSAGNEGKLYILEDPFGHLPEGSILNQLLRLKSLIANLPRHTGRYLIVTSNTRVLIDVFPGVNLPWIDLQVKDRRFLKDIWQKLTDNETKVPPVLYDTVHNLLENDPDSSLFQPGHLSHLANSAPYVKLSDLGVIREYAYVDASKISAEIPPDYVKEFATLSCLAGTVTNCSITEIAFVTSENTSEQPGLQEEAKPLRLEKEIIDFPQYKHSYFLQSEIQDALDYLEDRGYIIRVNDFYRFSHPMYLQAARLCLNPTPGLSHDTIKKLLIRSLSTLNYDVANNAINTISYIIRNIASLRKQSYMRSLLEVVEYGLRSIFPGIQDQSFSLLLQYFDQLNEETRKEIEKRNEHSSSHIHFIQWHKEIPFIPNKKIVRVYMMKDIQLPTDKGKTETGLKLASGELVSPKAAWEYLQYTKDNIRRRKSRVSADVGAMKKALLYNELFIKESAAYLLAASISDQEIDLLEALFKEEEPQILFYVLKGAWRSYPYFTSAENKAKVRSWIINAMAQKWLALRSIDLITQFDTHYSSHSFDWMYEIEESIVPDMWEVWAEVTPVVLAHLPIKVSINDGRFNNTLITAVKMLPASANLRIIKSLITWINKFPDHYEQRKHILENLVFYFGLSISQLPPADRLAVIEELTTVNIIMLRCILYRQLLVDWEKLTPLEHTVLLQKLSSEHNTVQAVALTGKNNKAVQLAICDQPFDIDKIPEVIASISEKQLLQCLITQYIDTNLRELNYADYEFWNETFIYLLKQEENSLAKQVTIYWLIKKYILSDAEISDLEIPDLKNKLEYIYIQGTTLSQDWITATICYFYYMAHVQFSQRLSALLSSLPAEIQQSFLNIFTEFVSIFFEPEKIENLLTELKQDLSNYFPADVFVLNLLHSNPNDPSQVANTCLPYFEKGKIKIAETIEVFREWLEKYPSALSTSDTEQFEAACSAFYTNSKNKSEELFEIVHQPFDNFIPELT